MNPEPACCLLEFRCNECNAVNYACYKDGSEDSLDKSCSTCGFYHKKVSRIDNIINSATINMEAFFDTLKRYR